MFDLSKISWHIFAPRIWLIGSADLNTPVTPKNQNVPLFPVFSYRKTIDFLDLADHHKCASHSEEYRSGGTEEVEV